MGGEYCRVSYPATIVRGRFDAPTHADRRPDFTWGEHEGRGVDSRSDPKAPILLSPTADARRKEAAIRRRVCFIPISRRNPIAVAYRRTLLTRPLGALSATQLRFLKTLIVDRPPGWLPGGHRRAAGPWQQPIGEMLSMWWSLDLAGAVESLGHTDSRVSCCEPETRRGFAPAACRCTDPDPPLFSSSTDATQGLCAFDASWRDSRGTAQFA